MKAAVTRGLKTGSTGIHQWWFRYGSPAWEPLGCRQAAWPWEALKIWLCSLCWAVASVAFHHVSAGSPPPPPQLSILFYWRGFKVFFSISSSP